MDDILDFDNNRDNNKTTYVDYLFIQTNQLGTIVEVLEEHDIDYCVNEVENMNNVGFIPLSAEALSYRNNYRIQIPQNLHAKADYILAEYPELLEDSSEVRKVFLTNSLDEEGLIDVLLFPEEWEEQDDELVLEILAAKGIEIPVSEYHQRRIEREAERKREEKPISFEKIKVFIVVFLLLCVLFGIILSGNSLF